MRRLIWLILAAMLLTTGAGATDGLDERFDISAVEQAVPEDAAQLMEDVEPGGSFSGGLAAIVRNALQQLNDPIRDSAAACALLLGIVLLCAVAAAGAQDQANRAVHIAGILALCSAGLLSVRSLVRMGTEAMHELQSFADVFLPVMTAATAASGGFTSSTALQIGTVFFSDLLMHAMTGLFAPAIYLYLGLKAADAAMDGSCLGSTAALMKGALQTGLKAILFLFSAYLAITGIISGSADATTVKAAKLTLSGVVPVVGSMISDASEAVVVSAGLVRNSVGVFGMLAVLGICIGPFLEVAVPYLMLKVCAALCAGFGLKAHVSMLEAMGQALGFVLAMTGTGALLLLVACVCYMRVV